MTAAHLTTVSQNYAREITTPEFGCGLEGILKKRADASELSGILNGIDESWDPRFCSILRTPFGPGDWLGRSANADQVRRDFGLAVSPGIRPRCPACPTKKVSTLFSMQPTRLSAQAAS